MDGARFDGVVRTLTAAASRRATITGLIAGLLATFSSVVDPEAARRQKKGKRKKKSCPPCKKRKKGKCKGALPDGAACPEGMCQGGNCVAPRPQSPPPPPACGAGGPCVVFLSSVVYTGNLGGLDGADAKCQTLANAAGLPGAYKAWLSDLTSSPKARFTPSTGPYRLVNGATIAANWSDLTDGTLSAPITVTETGGAVDDIAWAWTSTKNDGAPSGPIAGVTNVHCSNWSTTSGATVRGAYGRVDSPADWSAAGFTTCDQRWHLYCFQNSSAPVDPPQTRLTITTVAAGAGAAVLPGACYSVVDANGSGAEVEVCDDDDGANNGITTFTLRDASTYVIIQTQAPSGYQPSGDAHEVEVPFGQETKVTITNQPL